MLEISRFLLSVIVVEAHIWPLNIPWLAWQSVFAFYTLSGFLMTRVLHERYGFTAAGIAAFGLNRILRLWPTYLAILALTLLAMTFTSLNFINVQMRWPISIGEWVPDLAILGVVAFDYRWMASLPVVVPNTWSLSVEVFCYVILAIYFGQTPARLVALAVIGAAALTISTATCSVDPIPYGGALCFQNRYGVLQAGFIPFAMGGLVYFHRAAVVAFIGRHRRLLVSGLILIFALSGIIKVGRFTVAPFVGSLAMVWLLAEAFEANHRGALTDFLGRCSYHLFLAHWAIAAVLIKAIGFQQGRFPVFVATLVVGVILSTALVPMEHGIDQLRRVLPDAIRKRFQ